MARRSFSIQRHDNPGASDDSPFLWEASSAARQRAGRQRHWLPEKAVDAWIDTAA
jgi:hypothetical protein